MLEMDKDLHAIRVKNSGASQNDTQSVAKSD